jgi:hypothetical protein
MRVRWTQILDARRKSGPVASKGPSRSEPACLRPTALRAWGSHSVETSVSMRQRRQPSQPELIGRSMKMHGFLGPHNVGNSSTGRNDKLCSRAAAERGRPAERGPRPEAGFSYQPDARLSLMPRSSVAYRRLASRVLSERGIAVIWQLHLDVSAHLVGLPGAAALLLAIADAAEELVWWRTQVSEAPKRDL